MESAPKRTPIPASQEGHAHPVSARTRGTPGDRRLVLRTEEFDVHVQLSGEVPRRRVTGEIVTRRGIVPMDTVQIHLLRDGERVATSRVGALGEFAFDYVPEGLLSVQIDLPNLTVVGALNLSE